MTAPDNPGRGQSVCTRMEAPNRRETWRCQKCQSARTPRSDVGNHSSDQACRRTHQTGHLRTRKRIRAIAGCDGSRLSARNDSRRLERGWKNPHQTVSWRSCLKQPDLKVCRTRVLSRHIKIAEQSPSTLAWSRSWRECSLSRHGRAESARTSTPIWQRFGNCPSTRSIRRIPLCHHPSRLPTSSPRTRSALD